MSSSSRRSIHISVFAFLLLVGACGSGGGGGQLDAAPMIDAVPTPTIDANACLATKDYGDAGALPEGQAASKAGGQAILMTTGLNGDPDMLSLELYSGFGVFADGIQAGTYELAAAEAQLNTCGACLRILADFKKGSNTWAQDYLAQSGTLVLSSVDGTLSGSLANVTFRHVMVNNPGTPTISSTVIEDGCDSMLAAASFSVAISVEAEGGR